MIGIQYPTITVGTHENLIVRFSIAAQVLMIRWGINPNDLNSHLRRGDEPHPEGVPNLIKMFAAMVAENFLGTGPAESFSLDKAPTPDYWACHVSPLDFAAVNTVVLESVGKVAEARRAASPPPKLEAVS